LPFLKDTDNQDIRMVSSRRLRCRWVTRRLLWRSAGLLAALVLGSAAAIPPALALSSRWQNARLRDAVLVAAANEKHAAVVDLARQALAADPDSGEIVAVLFRAGKALDHPQRVRFARQLLEVGEEISSADRLAAWQTFCELAPAGPVMALWGNLPAGEKADSRFVAPFVDRMIVDGMVGVAADLLEEQARPLPPELDERLVRLLLATGDGALSGMFQDALAARLNARSRSSGLILPLLDEVPQQVLQRSLFTALSQWLEVTGQVSLENRLRLARCEMAAFPSRAEAVFATALATARETDPLAAARWCLQLGRLEEARELLATFSLKQHPEAFLLECRLHEQAGDLGSWALLLHEPPPGIFLPALLCDRVHVADLLGERVGRAHHEEAAIREAAVAADGQGLVRLARHAQTRGMTDLACRAWVRAICSGGGALPPASQLQWVIDGLEAAGRESELFHVLVSLRQMEPRNDSLAIQHGYLSLVTGRRTPASLLAELGPLLENSSGFSRLRRAMAIACLLSDQPGETLEWTDDLDAGANGSLPVIRAARGLALSQIGRHVEAQEMLEGIPWGAMLPSEKRLLRRMMKSSDMAHLSKH
jgi:hypothetical protein